MLNAYWEIIRKMRTLVGMLIILSVSERGNEKDTDSGIEYKSGRTVKELLLLHHAMRG